MTLTYSLCSYEIPVVAYRARAHPPCRRSFFRFGARPAGTSVL